MTRHKRFLIVRADGTTLGSNVSFEGAAHTAGVMAGNETIAVLDSRTALALARFGGAS